MLLRQAQDKLIKPGMTAVRDMRDSIQLNDVKAIWPFKKVSSNQYIIKSILHS